MHCRTDFFDPTFRQLLATVIGPTSQQNNMIELYGIKCLGLFALVSEKLCRNYFEIFESSLTTYWDQLESGNPPDYIATVRAIISLRAVVDYILLFNLNKDP